MPITLAIGMPGGEIVQRNRAEGIKWAASPSPGPPGSQMSGTDGNPYIVLSLA